MREPIPAPFVIFGVTAEGISNPVPTPAGPKYPHEPQANALHNFIEGTAPSIPQWAPSAELAAGALVLIILALTGGIIWLSAPILLLTVGGLSYGTWYAYESSYLLDVSGIVVISILFLSIVTFRNFITQYLLRLQIKQQFGTYVSPALVEKLQNNPKITGTGWRYETTNFPFFGYPRIYSHL